MNRINITMIEVAGVCNASCSYCPKGNGLIKDNRNGLISIRTFDKALDLAKLGTQKAILLHHGGEPFLHPKLALLINKVRAQGYFAYMSTNLITATPIKMKECLEAGINFIEIHYSGGLTKKNHNQILKRIHNLLKLNWSIRNNGCKIEINYGLIPGETVHDVRKMMEKSPYYDDQLNIRFYEPHDWSRLAKLEQRRIKASDCTWYKTKSCAILSNGDIVICCLDQFRYSFKVNISALNKISWNCLDNRKICSGCVQHRYDNNMRWLIDDVLNVPLWLKSKLKIDSLES